MAALAVLPGAANAAPLCPAETLAQSVTSVRALRYLRDILADTARAAVFVMLGHAYLEQELTRLDFYDGPIDGALNNTTIRSIYALCKAAGRTSDCTPGPLSPSATDVLSDVFSDEKHLVDPVTDNNGGTSKNVAPQKLPQKRPVDLGL